MASLFHFLSLCRSVIYHPNTCVQSSTQTLIHAHIHICCGCYIVASPCDLSPVLKLLKMATGMRALLDTVVQALPQVCVITHTLTHTHRASAYHKDTQELLINICGMINDLRRQKLPENYDFQEVGL